MADHGRRRMYLTVAGHLAIPGVWEWFIAIHPELGDLERSEGSQ